MKEKKIKNKERKKPNRFTPKNTMPVKIVLVSTISIAVNVVEPHKQQHHIQLDRQIIECLVLIFHTLFAAIIGFDSIIIFAMPSLSKHVSGMGISATILWHQMMVAGLTHVFDTFNSQSVWTITINLIPAVDLMQCTAKLWPAHWFKIERQQQRQLNIRRRRRPGPQNFMTIAAHQNNSTKSIFRFRKPFKSRCKLFAERNC